MHKKDHDVHRIVATMEALSSLRQIRSFLLAAENSPQTRLGIVRWWKTTEGTGALFNKLMRRGFPLSSFLL